VHSLQDKPFFRDKIRALRMATLPAEPEDQRWESVPKADIRLGSVIYRKGKILPTRTNLISVQTVYNGEEILFRLTWHDQQENRESPSDAVGFFLMPDRRRKLEIGSLNSWPASKEIQALDLCYWSASKQSAVETSAQDIQGLESITASGQLLESQASYEQGRWRLLLKRRLKPQGAGLVNLAVGQPVLVGFSVWDGSNGEQDSHRASSAWIDLVLN